MFERIIGVFRLNANTFEEIEADQSATGQAALIVLIIGLISGLGSVWGATFVEGGSPARSFISALVSTLAGWLVWSFVSYLVGTSLFGGKANLGEMLRVIGFAYAPQVLSVIPCIGWIVGSIWSLIAGFIAVRQGLDLDNTKAFLTVLVGFIVYIIIFAVLGLVLGGAGLMFQAITG